ncbi:MAG: zinc ribbon domain-containing protein [Clostridia bacterium]|nr:zinc ribbon domain-containing protein [Clostridia bacterium]
MKFCTHCGKELLDAAVICPGCGCAVEGQGGVPGVTAADGNALLTKLSERVKTNGIIWLVIAVLQMIGGLVFNWFLLVVGVLNIVSAIKDLQSSKTIPQNPVGIVKNAEPLTGPIITLVYNLVIGGIIGVAGSIYYFIAIRNFVMENKETFLALESAAAPSVSNM